MGEIIARVSYRIMDGRDRAVETAHKAETAGWEHVRVEPDIVHGTYNVTADEPSDTTGR